MKIRKRFYLPAIAILFVLLLSLLNRALSRHNPPYARELNGVAEKYYQSPHSLNGDSLTLVKIKPVDSKSFEKFTQDHGMKPIVNVSNIMFFDFHQEQEWWPPSETFEQWQKFYRRDLDNRTEMFACLMEDVCYISYKAW